MPRGGKKTSSKSGRAGAAKVAGKQQKKKKLNNPLFRPRPRTFGVGKDLPPPRDMSRFVKWPRYIIIQRQRRVLMNRLKVPPAVNQFSQTLDKAQAGEVLKLLGKYRPEDRRAKARRLRYEAKERAAGREVEKKKPFAVKYGLNHVTTLVENNKAKLVLIAHDVDPLELVVWLPTLCRKKGVPYAIIKGKSRLGTLVNQKQATAVAITQVDQGDMADLARIAKSCKEQFNDRGEEIRKQWGGKEVGIKSRHRRTAMEKRLADEEKARTG